MKTCRENSDRSVCGTPSERQRQMRLLEFAMHHAGAALAEHRRLRLWRRRAVEARKPLRHFLHHPLVIDGAGGGHHHVGTAIMRRKVAAQRIAVEGFRVFAVPSNERPIGWSG